MFFMIFTEYLHNGTTAGLGTGLASHNLRDRTRRKHVDGSGGQEWQSRERDKTMIPSYRQLSNLYCYIVLRMYRVYRVAPGNKLPYAFTKPGNDVGIEESASKTGYSVVPGHVPHRPAAIHIPGFLFIRSTSNFSSTETS